MLIEPDIVFGTRIHGKLDKSFYPLQVYNLVEKEEQ